MVSMMKTPAMKQYLAQLTTAGCRTKYDKQAGIVECYDNEICVMKGIQKGRNGAWIMRFTNSDNIKWDKQ